MRERLARALSVLVSMLAYLGLAIAGSGGFDAYFRTRRWSHWQSCWLPCRASPSLPAGT